MTIAKGAKTLNEEKKQPLPSSMAEEFIALLKAMIDSSNRLSETMEEFSTKFEPDSGKYELPENEAQAETLKQLHGELVKAMARLGGQMER